MEQTSKDSPTRSDEAAIIEAGRRRRELAPPRVDKGLIKRAAKLVETAVEEWLIWASGRPSLQRTAARIRGLGIKRAARLATRTALEGAARSRIHTQVALAIGRRCEIERARDFLLGSLGPVKLHELERGAEKGKRELAILAAPGFSNWSNEARMRVGLALLGTVEHATGLVVSELRWGAQGPGDSKSTRMLSLHPDAEAWLEALAPPDALHAPLTAPPLDWSDELQGGGYSAEELREPLVRDVEEPVARTAPAVAKAVNVLQRTAWRVNRAVYEVALDGWRRGVALPNMPRLETEPTPPKPDDGVLAWRKECQVIERRTERMLARRMSTANALRTARAMLSVPAFYHVHRLDYRGRVYPKATELSWTGSDLSRGLLEFAEPVPCDERMLAQQVARAFGLSKATWAEREAWTLANERRILRTCADPFGESRGWIDAGDPWQYLAACFAWRDLRGGGSAHAHLPCVIDGSANALQLISLLQRNVRLAGKCNALPTDRPKDVYLDVADAIGKVIRSRAKAGEWTAERWVQVLQGRGLPRDISKLGLLGIAYGVRRRTLSDKVANWLDEQNVKVFGWQTGYASRGMALALWNIANLMLPETFVFRRWAYQAARGLAKREDALEWTTPSGFKILCDHQRKQSRQIDASVGGKLAMASIQESTGEADQEQRARAFGPNLLQGLDAAILHLVVGELGAPIGTAHDAFCVHAGNMEALRRKVREVYARVFEGDVLGGLEGRAGVELPGREEGTLDPRALIEAEYLFS